jgi:hypothetical protein
MDAPAKDPLAVEFGRRGGKARVAAMTPQQLRDANRKAALARWHKKADAPDPTDPNAPERDQKGGGRVLCQPRKPCRPQPRISTQPALFELPEAA